MTPVLVLWEDATKDIEFDGSPEDAGATEMCLEIGFLLRRTKKIVVLASEKSLDNTSVRWIMTIPTKMVKSITPLVEVSDFSPSSPGS